MRLREILRELSQRLTKESLRAGRLFASAICSRECVEAALRDVQPDATVTSLPTR